MSRKTVSDNEKKEILERFQNGSKIKEIAKDFKFTISTITRQLKNLLGEDEFINIKNKINMNHPNTYQIKDASEKIEEINNEVNKLSKNINYLEETDNFSDDSFFEIAPLDFEIDLEKQKDISSKPIGSVEFPKTVFMIVDSKIELQPKLLKEYPYWSFLPEIDLKRKTIEIFSDQILAKKFCSHNQKVIKVPNPNVFFIASELLKRKGISRIVFDQLLLSL